MTEIRVLGELQWTNYKGQAHTVQILNGLWSSDRMFGKAGAKIYMGVLPVALEENIAHFVPNLDGIAFEFCLMTKIPPQVFTVKSLTRLWIQSCNVSEIPIEVCGLVNLTELKIRALWFRGCTGGDRSVAELVLTKRGAQHTYMVAVSCCAKCSS